MHTLEPGVDAEATGGWKPVSGVAAHQDTTLDEALGNGGVELPEANRQHVDIEFGHTDGRPHPVRGPFVREHLRGPFLFADIDLAQPATPSIEGLQDSLGGIGRDEEEDTVAVLDQRLDIGLEVAVDEVREIPTTFQPDAEGAANEACGTIRPDQRRGSEAFGRPGLATVDFDFDIGVTRVAASEHGGHLGGEPELDQTAGPGRVEHDLLDEFLRRHDRLGRADVRPRAFEPERIDVPELVAGDGVEEADGALPAGGVSIDRKRR